MNANWRCSLPLAVAMLLAASAFAVDAEPQMLEGTVVSAGQGSLAMKDAAGKSHSFKVEVATKITFHGKPGKLEEFQPGMPVLVTRGAENKLLALSTIDEIKLVSNP